MGWLVVFRAVLLQVLLFMITLRVTNPTPLVSPTTSLYLKMPLSFGAVLLQYTDPLQYLSLYLSIYGNLIEQYFQAFHGFDHLFLE